MTLRGLVPLVVAVAVVATTSAELGAAEKIAPGFANCALPDGKLKVSNTATKRNIFFLATAPGAEFETFRFTAFKTKKKKLRRALDVGFDTLPFATLSYPTDVPADKVIAFGYTRTDLKTNQILGSWKMGAGTTVHVRLLGFNPKKRRLWGEFSAEGLVDQLGGVGPIDVDNGTFNLKQETPVIH